MSSLQATGSDSVVDHHESSEGLYRRFATVAWNKLLDTGWLVQEMANNNDTDEESTGLDSEETASDSSETRTFERLHVQQAPAKGMPPGSTVKIEIRALRPSRPDVPVQYARLALLETLVPSNSTATTTTTRIQSQGIQVLNLVVFPSPDNHHPQPHPQQEQPFPVWGADFVSLPGGKHLFLLDAQPMGPNCTWYEWWKDWQEQRIMDSEEQGESFNVFSTWGGPLPPAVQRFVSPHALWTRLVEGESIPPQNDDQPEPEQVLDNDRVKDLVQTQLLSLYEQHLDVYLNLLSSSSSMPEPPTSDNDDNDDDTNRNWFDEYLSYRLENDPARPMLKSLYGAEWTEQILEQVLFPSWLRRGTPPS